MLRRPVMAVPDDEPVTSRLAALAARPLRWGRALAAAVLWPVRTAPRMLALAWMVGLLVVGSASNAMAADDGLITSPDLGSAGGETFFERFGTTAFTVPVDTDSDHDGGQSYLWDLINAVTNLVLWFGLTLLRGALVAIQWLFSLDIYDEQSDAIDRAMAGLNTGVFLPLMVMTIAIAGFSVYARARRDGGGIIGEVVWMAAAAILAFTIMAQPSRILGAVDEARVAAGSAMMTTYADVAGGTESSTGYPSPDTGGDTDGAIRALTDSLWNTYGVSGWCYVAWQSVGNCQVVGQQYLEEPDATDGPWGDANVALEDDGEVAPFGASTGWVRGQEAGRLGAAALVSVMAVAAAICLFALFAFGLMAVIGVIVLILVGVIFLAFWVIPGRPRQIGVAWLQMLLGTFLQSVLITAIIGAVMVTGSLFNAGVATYGILMTAAFNVVALFLGLRYRGAFEHMLGFGTASSTGTSPMTSYMAMRMLGAGTRLGKRTLGGAIAGGHAAGRGIGNGAMAGASGARRAGNGLYGATATAGRRGQYVLNRLAPLRAAGVAGAGQPGTPPPAAPPGAAQPVQPVRRLTAAEQAARPAPPPPPPAPPAAPRPARPATGTPAARPASMNPPSPPAPPPTAPASAPATARPAAPRAPRAAAPPPPPPPPSPPATTARPRMAAPRHYKLAPVRKDGTP